MLISEEYRELNTELHQDRSTYGANGYKFAPLVWAMVHRYGYESVLDYGCGKGTLLAEMEKNPPAPVYLARTALRQYDPAYKNTSKPTPSDLVICTDVLEHVEPACLEHVLCDLENLTQQCLFATIATRPAHKNLADGRNAHLIVESALWWLNKLDAHFKLKHISIDHDKGEVTVECLKK